MTSLISLAPTNALSLHSYRSGECARERPEGGAQETTQKPGLPDVRPWRRTVVLGCWG